MLCFIVAAIAVLPAVLSSETYELVPFGEQLHQMLQFIGNNFIPNFLRIHLGFYSVPAILLVWTIFFLCTMNRPFFWWMVPYSLLVLYTFFILSSLQSGAVEPAFLLNRLSRDPRMGVVLLILVVLLEFTIFLLFTVGSVRLNRLYREKWMRLPAENTKLAPKKVKREARKQAKDTSLGEKKRRKKDRHSQDDEDDAAMVTVDRSEGPKSPSTNMAYSIGAEDDDSPLEFPPIKDLPKLRTIGNSADIYVGSVKVKDDESILVADTPVEVEDEPEDPPVGRTYDPIPSLRKRMAEDAKVAQIEVPTSFPEQPVVPVQEATHSNIEKSRSSEPVAKKDMERKVAAAEPEPIVRAVVEEEETDEDSDDMDLISGVGGLVSSNEGSSALLTRNKINYSYPSEDLLDTYPDHVTSIDEQTREAGENLINTLKQFKIEATLMNIVKGPTVTMFEVSPAPGVRVSSIISLSDNIALQLAARQVRIVAPIPGKQAVGIEVPNKHRSIIGFKDLLSTIDEKSYQVPMILGRKITGEPVVIEITQTPHLLIAGATGSGKSVCVNSLISSLLYRRSPKEVRLILVDPKIVELRVYNGIPHLLTPVITEPKKTIKALEFCLYEMDRRYKLLNALAVRNIAAYNRKIVELKLARERLPYIVVVIDEFADLMTTVGKELETLLARLAAMARAVGIHLVLATQRPSANVITGIIKSNIPTRIAFMVASQIDSRIIIDETGAEKLLGRGDMLFAPGWDPNSVRIQGAFLSDEEVERIVAFAKTQGAPDYLDEAFFEDEDTGSNGDDDDNSDDSSDEALMEKALKIVVERQSASASYLQRRLKIGYNRAARLVEQMEDDGYVGPARGSKPRELLKYPE